MSARAEDDVCRRARRSMSRYSATSLHPVGESLVPPPSLPPGMARTTGFESRRLRSSTSIQARRYDMRSFLAAAEIEPVSRMASRSAIFPGPIARVLPFTTRKWNCACAFVIGAIGLSSCDGEVYCNDGIADSRSDGVPSKRVILNLAAFFAFHVLWPEGFSGPFEWFSLVVGVAALAALWRYRTGMIPVIFACGAAGLSYRLLVG